MVISNGDPKVSAPDCLGNFLAANPTIDFIRCQWIDFGAIVRCFVVPTDYAREMAAKQKGGLNTVRPVVRLLAPGGVMDVGGIDIGEDHLIPDWSSLLVCGYHDGHATVMCWVESGKGVDGPTGFDLCPRSALARQVERAKRDQNGLEFLVGSEVEFLIFAPKEERDAPPSMFDIGCFSTAHLTTRYLPIVDEIARTLKKAGIKVMKFHSEDGPLGMFEMCLSPLAPVEAADALVFCHETIRTICSRNGLKGTVFPSPWEKSLHLGAHTHISMEGEGKEKEESFLAGMLKSMRGISAFTMPNFDSCDRKSRLKHWICWGTRNKLCMVRKIRQGYWEIRCVDGCANTYLALASLLAAGLEGLEEETELTIGDQRSIDFINGHTEDQRKELRITEMLPNSMAEGLDALNADKALKDALGSELVEGYVALKRKEEEAFGHLGAGARREASMRWF